jgi:hypothetical protein
MQKRFHIFHNIVRYIEQTIKTTSLTGKLYDKIIILDYERKPGKDGVAPALYKNVSSLDLYKSTGHVVKYHQGSYILCTFLQAN